MTNMLEIERQLELERQRAASEKTKETPPVPPPPPDKQARQRISELERQAQQAQDIAEGKGLPTGAAMTGLAGMSEFQKAQAGIPTKQELKREAESTRAKADILRSYHESQRRIADIEKKVGLPDWEVDTEALTKAKEQLAKQGEALAALTSKQMSPFVTAEEGGRYSVNVDAAIKARVSEATLLKAGISEDAIDRAKSRIKKGEPEPITEAKAKREAAAERFVSQQELARFKRLNTKLPDGEYVSKAELKAIKKEDKQLYSLLTTKGVEAANSYLEKARQEAIKQAGDKASPEDIQFVKLDAVFRDSPKSEIEMAVAQVIATGAIETEISKGKKLEIKDAKAYYDNLSRADKETVINAWIAMPGIREEARQQALQIARASAIGIIPVVGTIYLWNKMPGWMQGLSIAGDVLILASVFSPYLKAAVGGARQQKVISSIQGAVAEERTTLKALMPNNVVKAYDDYVDAARAYAKNLTEIENTKSMITGAKYGIKPEWTVDLEILQKETQALKDRVIKAGDGFASLQKAADAKKPVTQFRSEDYHTLIGKAGGDTDILADLGKRSARDIEQTVIKIYAGKIPSLSKLQKQYISSLNELSGLKKDWTKSLKVARPGEVITLNNEYTGKVAVTQQRIAQIEQQIKIARSGEIVNLTVQRAKIVDTIEKLNLQKMATKDIVKTRGLTKRIYELEKQAKSIEQQQAEALQYLEIEWAEPIPTSSGRGVATAAPPVEVPTKYVGGGSRKAAYEWNYLQRLREARELDRLREKTLREALEDWGEYEGVTQSPTPITLPRQSIAVVEAPAKPAKKEKEEVETLVVPATITLPKAQAKAQVEVETRPKTKPKEKVQEVTETEAATMPLAKPQPAAVPSEKVEIVPVVKEEPQQKPVPEIKTPIKVTTTTTTVEPPRIITPVPLASGGPSDKANRRLIKQAKLSIGWRQGELRGQDRYDVILDPFTPTEKYLIVMGKRPQGLTSYVKGPRSAYKTAQVLTGRLSRAGIVDNPGIFSTQLWPVGTKKLGLKFIPDAEASQPITDKTPGITERVPPLSRRQRLPRRAGIRITPRTPRLR